MNGATNRALTLFDDYLALPPMQRAEALASLAREDPGTHAVLHRLLASDAALGTGAQPDLLAQLPDALATADTLARDPLLGRRLGPCRIERIVSIGGMGTD